MDKERSVFELKMQNSGGSKKDRKTVLLDPFPAMGHVNAFLNLAEWLRRQGFSPVFLISYEYEEKVRQAGFDYYVVTPILLIPAKYEIKQEGVFRFFLDNLYKGREYSGKAFREKAEDTYAKVFRVEDCKLVLLDIHYKAKALFYHFKGIEVIQISTAMLPFRHLGSPPFQSSFVPYLGWFSALRVSVLWAMNRVKRDFRNSIDYILSLGQTDLNIMLKTYAQRKYTFERNRALGWGISGVPTVATYPKAFDLVDFSKRGDVFYLDELPCPAGMGLGDPRLVSIVTLKKIEGKCLVYCSLGTVTKEFQRDCERFFNKVLDVAKAKTKLHFILNIGQHFDVHKLDDLPDNVSVFDRVEQHRLLKEVDVMINHGGINSIKECIVNEVPMLVYPLSPYWDQPGCAARVVKCGLGLKGNIRKDSSRQLLGKLDTLFRNLHLYRSNIRTFLGQVDQDKSESVNRLIDLLNDE
ncbi:hypothetical protein DN752_16820 [Echinicola strongylocentroti]|uniref:Glycosyl transferase n=1 Tax=Echinicola strongylocentroti TaxID=1795355 RepID=A0A2Z4IL29_9BACT|nr:hypothetical protein [Echinicola strongylocentroti]AWW31655.1 hypothetical protein DN752_16820 [Echinicola strongylocentroti]